jgi:hypothetical protein
MDIVLKAIRNLVAEIKLTVAESTNISLAEVERRLDGDRLVIAPAARKYADSLRVLWAWLNEEDTGHREYWMARYWIRRFALTPVYADDPITDDDIQDDKEYRLRPGEVISFLLAHDCEFIEGPYPTQEENEIFFEAQRGGYSQDGDDPFHFDTTDTRIPDGWAEYLDPVGASQFYGNAVWKWLREATQDAIEEADRLIRGLALNPYQKWDYVRDLIREDVERVWATAVDEYLGGEMNVVALAMVAHRLTSATRFTPEEMLARARKVPWFSHVDGAQLGTFDQFLVEYRDELDDIVDEGVGQDWSPVWPWEEQRVADQWSEHFERELEAHWTAQAKERKPILVENGTKIWASQFTGMADVAYNLAYLRSVAMGFTKAEVIAAAEKARNGVKKWVPNPHREEYFVVGANQKGVVLADRTMMLWV